MAKKPKSRLLVNVFEDKPEVETEVALEVAPSRAESGPSWQSYGYEPAQKVDILRRVNRSAEGVVREGAHVTIPMPNGQQVRVVLKAGAGSSIKDTDVMAWERFA